MKNSVLYNLKELDNIIIKKTFMMSQNKPKTLPPTPMQFSIVTYLNLHKGEEVFQKDLEKELNVSRATISSVLQTLEKNGNIKRVASGKDARVKRVELTKEAKDFHDEMKKLFITLETQALRGISEQEIKLFFDVTDKIKKNLKDIEREKNV